MSFILRDFECCSCSLLYEELVSREENTSYCPECGEHNMPIISAPGIATYSLMDRQQQTSHLKERSRKHSQKLMKQEAGKWFEKS